MSQLIADTRICAEWGREFAANSRGSHSLTEGQGGLHLHGLANPVCP